MASKLVLQIGRLRQMTVGELRERYRDVFGQETRSRNKDWLCKRVAWGLQELRYGGLSDRARARARELAEGAPIRQRMPNGAAHPRDPRLPPPGSVIDREHGGVTHQITVLAEGFEYRGERYASLSRVAKEITGTSWNGFLWVGLTKRKRKAKA